MIEGMKEGTWKELERREETGIKVRTKKIKIIKNERKTKRKYKKAKENRTVQDEKTRKNGSKKMSDNETATN